MAELLTASEIFYTSFEPKTKNRFILYVDGIPSFLIKQFSRPHVSQAAQPLDHINTRRFYKGKTIWQTMNMTLYDPLVPSGAQAVMEWERLHHESATGRDGYQDFYKKDLIINGLDPVGAKIEEWLIKGAEITDINFNEMDWSDEGSPLLINLTIQPDYCILQY